MTRRNRRLCTAALVALLPLQLLGISQDPSPKRDPDVAASTVMPREPLARPRAITPPPQPPATDAPVAAPDGVAAPAAEGALVTEPAVVPAASASRAPAEAHSSSQPSTWADRHPAHAAAVQDPSRPATTRWALLIGINEHLGGVSDNVGSRQDAEDLRSHLLANGWLEDHILTITDHDATRANILAGIQWLADKTDQDSVAIFHYSGHSKKWYGRDHDGDGEITDEGLWPADSRFIVDSELAGLLDAVRPHALWVNFATCNAAGLADPGLARSGRLLTFSSGEPQKSYEHPAWGNSVWGWFLIEQAMMGGLADADADGRVTVEEAFGWARPRASTTTSQQSHGPQDAVIVDLLDGDFDVLIPGAAPAAAPAAPSRTPSSPGTGDADPDPEPEPEPEDDRRGLCLLCGR